MLPSSRKNRIPLLLTAILLLAGISCNISSNKPGATHAPARRPTSSSPGTLSDGLVAFYPFNGNADDESGNGHNGALKGATLAQDRFGNADSAYHFDGMTANIVLPALTSQLAAGSVALWFNVDSWTPSDGNGLYLFSSAIGGNVGDGLSLGTHPSYTKNFSLMFGIYTNATEWKWADSGDSPAQGSWYFAVGTWGADGLKLYVNDELKGTDEYSGPAPAATQSEIGSSTWADTHVQGAIDEVRIYNRELTTAEIHTLYLLP